MHGRPFGKTDTAELTAALGAPVHIMANKIASGIAWSDHNLVDAMSITTFRVVRNLRT